MAVATLTVIIGIRNNGQRIDHEAVHIAGVEWCNLISFGVWCLVPIRTDAGGGGGGAVVSVG